MGDIITKERYKLFSAHFIWLWVLGKIFCFFFLNQTTLKSLEPLIGHLTFLVHKFWSKNNKLIN